MENELPYGSTPRPKSSPQKKGSVLKKNRTPRNHKRDFRLAYHILFPAVTFFISLSIEGAESFPAITEQDRSWEAIPFSHVSELLGVDECEHSLAYLNQLIFIHPLLEDHLRGLRMLCFLKEGLSAQALSEATVILGLYSPHPNWDTVARFLLEVSYCSLPPDSIPPPLRSVAVEGAVKIAQERGCAAVIRHLILRYPDMVSSLPSPTPPLSEAEEWERLYNLAQIGGAEKSYASAKKLGFVDSFSQLPLDRQLFLLRLAVRAGDDLRALKWITQLLQLRHLNQEQRGELVLLKGRILIRKGNPKETQKFWLKATRMDLHDALRRSLYYRLGILNEQEGRLLVAADHYRRSLTFPVESGEVEERVVRLGLLLMRLYKKEEAGELLRRAVLEADAEVLPRFLYLQGRLDPGIFFEQCKKISEIAPLSYYRYLCTSLLPITEPPFRSLLTSLAIPRHPKALLLEEVGLKEAALWEWESAASLLTDTAELVALARHLIELGEPHKALGILSQRVDLQSWNNGKFPDIELGRALYPTPYIQWVSESARSEGLDPYLIYAIMRQESRFDPWAKSRAKARGLLQLLWETALKVVLEGEQTLTAPQDLHDPRLNIALGSRYFRKLLELYNDDLFLALAAYNAGPQRVETWIATYKLPRDLWVEVIPFNETRGYVKKVLENYFRYRLLYTSPPPSPHLAEGKWEE